MTADWRTVARDMTALSDREAIAFPDVVARLTDAGVERYEADLTRALKTYYRPDGTSEAIPCDPLGAAPAEAFSAAGVEAAVRAIQAGRMGYKTFCARIADAGCVGYVVSIAVYYGRTMDSHVEWFPGARQ